MRRIHILTALTALAAVAMLCAASASAQALHTWVSGVGNDANPCSRTAPCLTFAGAFAKTATYGEISCLDPGEFGPLTITQSITIHCKAGATGVEALGQNGIFINTTLPNITVVLSGIKHQWPCAIG